MGDNVGPASTTNQPKLTAIHDQQQGTGRPQASRGCAAAQEERIGGRRIAWPGTRAISGLARSVDVKERPSERARLLTGRPSRGTWQACTGRTSGFAARLRKVQMGQQVQTHVRRWRGNHARKFRFDYRRGRSVACSRRSATPGLPKIRFSSLL